MIKLGDKNVTGVFYGETPVSKIYLGEQLVYEDNPIGLEGTIVESGNYVAGNVVLYDNNEEKKIVIDINNPTDKFPLSRYTPIAVIVIPSSHDFYGNGTAGAMSLAAMSKQTPDTGQLLNINASNGVDFGLNQRSLSYDRTIMRSGTSPGSYGASYASGYFPSDIFIDVENSINSKEDPLSKYISSSTYFAPPPYSNGERNTSYVGTSNNNVLWYYDGSVIAEDRLKDSYNTEYPNWRTDATIKGGTPNSASASCCCWRFHTEGTEQGDWYLPTVAELGYLVSRKLLISKSFLYIDSVIDNDYYKKAMIFTSSNQKVWSCSSYDYKNSWFVDTSTGRASTTDRATFFHVLAYIKIL